MMAQIQTVRGPIDSAQLGTTLMHEHVFVLDKEISENYVRARLRGADGLIA